ncbi:hypothetical protein SASPL_104740 [Salvia splendens]|uniref:Uncharacterized protein n=1 Tax=Salvia splendens TaxID=180675 RepID=A0A8X8YM81_SALSN|nr:hypothetical protein SASPL_104740 [Salvia splendens]
MNIRPQALFFYRGKWPANLDDQLLTTVVRMKDELHVEGSVIPEETLVEARAKIEARFGKGEDRGSLWFGFTSDECQERLQFLHTRLETFNVVVSTPNVWWSSKLKVVDATDSVWSQLLKCHPLADAYYHKEEAEYRRLTVIFIPRDVKQESFDSPAKFAAPEEVIVLSNTTSNHRDVINLTVCDSPFSEEVNSPATLISEKVKRKLFDEGDVESSDRESSNKPPTI